MPTAPKSTEQKPLPDLSSMGLRVEGNTLLILDQTRLPEEENWVTVESPEHMVAIIKDLKVRGAPLIGVAAAVSLANFAQKTNANSSEVMTAATALRNSRPTAVNLMNALDRMLKSKNLTETATEIFYEDVRLCEAMGKNGAALVNDGDSMLTHCNTGGLATVGIGTALSVAVEAHRQGKKIHVYVDETRPLLQGGRLTTWELKKHGIPYTLICDNMAAALMKKGKINKVFLGSDRVAMNGDFANKTGTYAVAVAAKFHGIDFYPVAPYTTIDPKCPNGDQIPIEERSEDEVRGARGSFGKVLFSPSDSPAYNPSFDVTPVELVTGLILDKGVFLQKDLKAGALENLF